MRISTRQLSCLICAFVLLASQAYAADEVKDQPTCLSLRGKLLLSDDFPGQALSAEWKHPKGTWTVADGVLKGVELADDKHAAVVRHELKAHDLVAQFSFKFDGGKQTAFSVNDVKGHVCRVQITPTGFGLMRDKPSKTSDEKAAVLDRVSTPIKSGEWHTMVVEIRSKEMVASVDGAQVAFGANAGIDVDKTNFGFPVSGDSISIAHVRVWEALPNPAWDATREKLEALRQKPAEALPKP